MNRVHLLAAASALAIAAGPIAVQAQQSGQAAQAQQSGQAAQTQPSGQQATQNQPRSGASPTQQQAAASMQANKPAAVVVLMLTPPAPTTAQPVSTEALYKGFRADTVIGQDVYGANGNQIGEVQEILVNKDGQITSIVVEGGGFLEFGDAAYRIPWKEVDLTPAKDGVVARNMTETKAENLGLFDGSETVLTGPREFRVGELTGDWALLRNGQGYGSVRDVVFSREGKAMAVLVNRDIRHGAGLYAYPFHGYGTGWDPALSYYALPFDSLAMAANATKVDAKRFDKST